MSSMVGLFCVGKNMAKLDKENKLQKRIGQKALKGYSVTADQVLTAIKGAFSLQNEWGVNCVMGDVPIDRLKEDPQQNQLKQLLNNEKEVLTSSEAARKGPEVVAPSNSLDLKPLIKDDDQSTNKGQTIKSMLSTEKVIAQAKTIAAQCSTLEELKEVVEAFEGCLLKKTANSTVFAAGDPKSKVMLLGEAPGADEDRQGFPFVGRSGKLLDKVFASIGLTREKNLYITNCLPWRPPGNRTPSLQEIAICRPFLLRHIQLVSPKILVLVGATALHALNGVQGPLSSFRDSWYKFKPQLDGDISLELIIKGSCYKNNKVLGEVVDFIHSQKGGIATYITYHPSYLLRSPVNKKKVWFDMLALQKVVENL